MPYTLRNEDLFCASLYGTFHRMEHVNELVRALQAINYGVVDSRRSGLEALESFENKGFTGDTLFGEDTRFPGGIRDTYMTQFMGEFGTVVISLQSSLSWRLDANPKDVKNISKSGQEESNYTEKNGEKQDNTKRFEELLKRLARMRSDVNELWRQRTFEYRVSAVWTEPAAQAAGQ